jgi:hypothetical protein
MKSKILVLAASLMLLTSSAALSQKPQERPKLHADFYFGTYPASREAATIMAKDKSRLLLVGFHNGWDIEKIAKESKSPEDEFERLFADFQEEGLATERDQYDFRPLLPVIRDKDLAKIEKNLKTHISEFTNHLRGNWPEIEAAIAPLTGAKGVPQSQLLYQVVVGGILFGGMNDAFFDDQTIMVSPRRRSGSQRYYAWLVEGNPKFAGVLKREQWESDGYTMVSIGSGMTAARISLDRIRTEKGMVLDEAEARRLRSFIAIFSKEKLLPYFKKNRESFRTAVNLLDSGKYVSLSEAFAWYYDQIANGVATELVGAGLIQQPNTHYAFAMKAPGR